MTSSFTICCAAAMLLPRFTGCKQAFEGKYDDEFILKWLKNFYRRFFAQQFKRSCLPDGPKVGTVAVSPRGDLRMPSDACGRSGWMRLISCNSKRRTIGKAT